MVNALYHTALVLGVQAVREPKRLHVQSNIRPDLRLGLPGQHILVDVAVCHPLAPGAVRSRRSLRTTGLARAKEQIKRKKYTELAAQRGAEMLPFCMETCGGMAPAALQLLKVLGEAGQEHLAMWPRDDVVRHLVGSVAVAVQRGSADAYLDGYARALARIGEDEASSVRWMS